MHDRTVGRGHVQVCVDPAARAVRESARGRERHPLSVSARAELPWVSIRTGVCDDYRFASGPCNHVDTAARRLRKRYRATLFAECDSVVDGAPLTRVPDRFDPPAVGMTTSSSFSAVVDRFTRRRLPSPFNLKNRLPVVSLSQDAGCVLIVWLIPVRIALRVAITVRCSTSFSWQISPPSIQASTTVFRFEVYLLVRQ